MSSNQQSAAGNQPAQRTRDELLRHKLGYAEIYLLDGARGHALRLVRECLEILNPALPAGEDLGDVSDHLLTSEALS